MIFYHDVAVRRVSMGILPYSNKKVIYIYIYIFKKYQFSWIKAIYSSIFC